MNYQLQYNICAIIICSIVLSKHILHKKTKEVHNTVFTAFILVSLIGAVINTANSYGNMHPGFMSQAMLEISDYLSFSMLNFPLFLFAVYSVVLVKNSIKSLSLFLKILLFLPEVVLFLALFTNPWTQAIFQYTNGIYRRGPYQLILYAIALYYILFSVVYILNARELVSRSVRFYVITFMAIGYFVAIVQFFNPELQLQHFGLAIGGLVIFINLQKSEEYIYADLGIYNQSILFKLTKMNLASDKKMQMLVLQVEDLNFIAHAFGSENQKALLRQIAFFLDSLSKKNVYYYKDGLFVILLTGNSIKQLPFFECGIKERFAQRWQLENAPLSINYKLISFSLPQDIADLDTLFFAIQTFAQMIPGKDHVVRFSDLDMKKIGRQIQIERIVQRAIAEDNFQIYYQPIYSAKEDRISSAEALIRLIDPDAGVIPPDEFIPIAEKNGTIIQIGEIVFDKVFRFLQDHALRQFGIDYIEINISAVQCMQDELARSILDHMAKYRIPADMINLEITETAEIGLPKVFAKNLTALSDSGVTFSLDDFGTGYSNITVLMTLPLDIIKLDRSLIDLAAKSQRGQNILSSAVTLVKKMGCKSVAEGVEEKEQMDMLRSMDIDYIQGYYVSKPLPETQFIEFISRKNILTIQ